MRSFLIASLLAMGVSADIRFFYRDQGLPYMGAIEDPISGRIGLTGADQLCMSTAGKSFVAALTDPHTKIYDRFAPGETVIRYSDGVALGERDTIFPGGVPVPILSFNGASPSAELRAYTGAATLGVGVSADNCNGWRDTTNNFRGELGYPSTTNNIQWYRSGNIDCDLPAQGETPFTLYCVEQNKVACIFVTDAPIGLAEGKGKAGLDEHCQNAFTPTGKAITANFAALVSTNAQDAIDVFPEEEGSYLLINTEGNVVQSLQYELFKSGTLFDNLILTLGRTTPAEPSVWSGSQVEFSESNENNSEYGIVAAANNCFNWNEGGAITPILGNFEAIVGDVSKTDTQLTNAGLDSCASEKNVICVQTSTITTSTVHGDPHFAGFDGSRYNFDGVSGQIFNIITDANFLFNAEFTEMEIYETTGTWMTKLGFRAGKESLVFDPAFGLLINGDELVKSGEHFTTEEFEVEIQWKNQRPANIVVRASGYEVTIKPVQVEPTKTFLDVQVALFVSPVNPHGVLGQTAKYIVDGSQPTPVKSKAKNAEDLLEGSYTDYMVKDGILGTEFTYNTFEGLVTGRGHVQTRNFIVARSSFVPLSWKESF